jgi:hypothetical protein
MKVFNEVGSKDRFLEVFQKVNKVQLNEAFGQSLNPSSVLEDSFSQLKSGNLNIEHSNTQANGNESFIELICLDRQNNNITFTFKATLSEGDQDGVYSIDSAIITAFSFDDSEGANSVEMEESQLRQFNMQHGSEIADIIDEYVDVDEPVDADMDEQYRTAIQRIDAVPYKKGTQDMVQQKQYGDEKPTNPDVRAGDEFNKFLAEEGSDDIQYNPEEIETGFEKPDEYSDAGEPEMNPEDMEVSNEEVPEEVKAMILQAYDNLVQKAEQERRYNYSPTQLEVEDEILRITGQKVIKQKTRALPKGAEAWLGEETGVITNPSMIAQKSLSPEKKREYIEKAYSFLENQLGAEKFFGLQADERNKMVAYYANEILTAELAGGNLGASMNEEEKSDYPDQMGKTFKPKSKYPKKKKKPQTTVKIDETENGMSFEPKGDEVEQLGQDKEQVGDMLSGGLADDKSPQEFDPEQIMMGIKVEMEHTDNPMTALEIAMDHLAEFSDYYTRLEKMEKDAEAEHGGESLEEKPEGEEGNKHPLADVMDIKIDDKETTDVLLGYEPKNVGETFDYASADVDYEEKDAMKKYLEYSEKNINGLGDDEKKEYFELWKQFKGSEKVNETLNKHIVVYDGASAYVEDENNIPDDVEIIGRYDNIDDAQAFADKYNDSAYAITEQKIKMAKQALNKRGLNEGMTKKEAVQILIKHNIK